MIPDILVSVNITNRNINKAKLIDARVSGNCTLLISQREAFLLFYSTEIKLICNICSSKYKQKISRLHKSPNRISMCGKCILKNAAEKMRYTLSTVEFRKKRSLTMKEYFSTEEGKVSSILRGKKHSEWRKNTLEGKLFSEKCKNHLPLLTGTQHPRYNSDKSNFKKFQYQVRKLTEKIYSENINLLNPSGFKRTLCGIDGGYQLDHIISIKSGYEMGMSVEELSHIDNLQLIPWKDNRIKATK